MKTNTWNTIVDCRIRHLLRGGQRANGCHIGQFLILMHRARLAAPITTGLGGSVTATIVSPGAGGAGHALQLSGNVTNGVTENAGVNSPSYVPSGNADPNLSDYTLSFDLAITHGANAGIGVTLNIFGGRARWFELCGAHWSKYRWRRVSALFGQYGHIAQRV